MNIEFKGKKGTYRLCSDDRTFIIYEDKVVAKGKHEGETISEVVCYTTKLEQALNTILMLEVKRSDATTLDELKTVLNTTKRWIDELFNV